ncbi:hypothetical protein COLO4_17742 [Corchorus olitorius]|uniref:TF-B3 domain-containing protein n=1 Tax=Corchorus olitorius TaxID=93759 RepID=A0A1R3JBN8_9ROSI|nr:hypothetical protein COLO4_17742 [Corchorus olitorius]
MFSKLLTETDIKKRLAIPSYVLPSLPDFKGRHAVEIRLVYGTRVWPIICSVRKMGYKKPVFSVGWRDFVTYNQFNVGDEFKLYKVQEENGSSFYYRVEVEKNKNHPISCSPAAVSVNRTKLFRNEPEQDQFKNEHEPEINFFAAKPSMGEPPFHAHYTTKLVLDIGGSTSSSSSGSLMAYSTCGHSDEEAYYKSKERLSLDLVLPPKSTPNHQGQVNLDLTLAQPQPQPLVDICIQTRGLDLKQQCLLTPTSN